ncbi:MAG: hypothetical protein ABW321_34425 [Polyangiales bacterium]
MLRTLVAASALAGAVSIGTACGENGELPALTRDAAVNADTDPGAPPGPAELAGTHRPAFCERRRDPPDPVQTLFCAEPPPQITSLQDLQEQLDVVPYSPRRPAGPDTNQPVLMSHSTALSGQLVSPINPRAIIVGADTIMAFHRGVQQVELLSSPPGILPEDKDFKLYLVSFRQACNAADGGCTHGDLYTPRIESDWTSLQIADDEQLKNSASDCRQCHLRSGTGKTQVLMREVDGPWTHFFDALPPAGLAVPLAPGVRGEDLMRDFLAAKGDERYAGVDVARYRPSAAVVLESAAGLTQPLYFDSLGIQSERWPRRGSGYDAQPAASPIWDNAYDAFKRGEQLALPYIDPRASDTAKQAQLTAAYASWRAGELEAAELPDLGDIFPDDPAERARIGLATEPDATPVDALIQACGACHNAVLDQTLSRAAFSIDVSLMTRDELDVAIDRIERPRNAPGAMPPLHTRQLPADVQAHLVAYLRDLPVGEGDARLAHAAEVGMTGGSRPATP